MVTGLMSTGAGVTAGASAQPSDTTTAAVRTGVLVDGDGYVLGGVRNGAFIPASQAVRYAKSGARYYAYSPVGLRTTVVGSRPQRNTDTCPDTYFMNVRPHLPRVAATRGLATIPRRVTAVKPDARLTKGVEKMLRAYGITTPVALKQAVSVDLDGDGRREVVVAAERLLFQDGYVTPTVRAGDYSLVAVFRNGTLVKTLGANYFRKAEQFTAPETYRISSLADFNRDGRFEIGVGSRYYEGSATTLFSASRTGLKPVLVAGCGS